MFRRPTRQPAPLGEGRGGDASRASERRGAASRVRVRACGRREKRAMRMSVDVGSRLTGLLLLSYVRNTAAPLARVRPGIRSNDDIRRAVSAVRWPARVERELQSRAEGRRVRRGLSSPARMSSSERSRYLARTYAARGAGRVAATSLVKSASPCTVVRGETGLGAGRVPRPGTVERAGGSVPWPVACGDRGWLRGGRFRGCRAVGRDAAGEFSRALPKSLRKRQAQKRSQ